MKIVVMDGQGGGVGRMFVERLRAALPEQMIVAVGANALATSAMLRAGATVGATGENAVMYNCRDADWLFGPSGVAVADAMLGEISPRMAEAVATSPAVKVLLPMDACAPGTSHQMSGMALGAAVDVLVREATASLPE